MIDKKRLAELDDLDFIVVQQKMSDAARERMHRETGKILAALKAKEAKKNVRKKK